MNISRNNQKMLAKKTVLVVNLVKIYIYRERSVVFFCLSPFKSC